MKPVGAFQLFIQPGDTLRPARVRIGLQTCVQDDAGNVYLTAECVSLEDIEGQINGLQDELDELRMQARRAYEATL